MAGLPERKSGVAIMVAKAALPRNPSHLPQLLRRHLCHMIAMQVLQLGRRAGHWGRELGVVRISTGVVLRQQVVGPPQPRHAGPPPHLYPMIVQLVSRIGRLVGQQKKEDGAAGMKARVVQQRRAQPAADKAKRVSNQKPSSSIGASPFSRLCLWLLHPWDYP
mmetsp:Transcript_51996/g.131416  ORF Transcript_51996/g.131416 Transcript_51996/m.131416 type:complete len:163 (-) Transcript_51996:142-630(-)